MRDVVVWIVALVIAFALGGAVAVRYEQGRAAVAENQELREAIKARDELQAQLDQQRRYEDEKGKLHAETTETLNTQLRDARSKLAALTTGRECLSARAVGVLNTAGLPAAPAVPAAASEPASAPEAFATDRDVGDALGLCHTEYGRIADQLNMILDIEDTRARGK